jgi:hypothetical protein
MVDGTTVITHLAGRIPIAVACERLEMWANGTSSAMIKQPLRLVGATAWEAHYNGVPVLHVPLT